ncbi:MAG: hypothetical protein C5B59_07675 [Bacteroidetes bacterium]|nr:MAG: hypothetical protein C5B59_07675 [Bacteroidota bacterium]
MKALFTKLLMLGCAVFLFSFNKPREDWPRVITAADGTVIKIYQPEPESFAGNVLKFRSAISVSENGTEDPVFGTFWSTSKMQTDRDSRQMNIESMKVTDIKIPAVTDQNKIEFIRSTLEYQFPDAAGQISLDEILASLDQNLQETRLSDNINTKPPKVIYTSQPSMLVLIDGPPRVQRNPQWNLDVVINSPFTIVKYEDGQYYLYGNHHWYMAPSPTGPYQYTNDNVPDALRNIESKLNSNPNNGNGNNPQGNNPPPTNGPSNDYAVVNIIVSTEPTELVQSNGEPNFSPIEGTSLLYMKNSNNDIFMDVNSQQYYVLISGRWYHSRTLGGNNWQFIPADQLPQDFAKIPEGSPKDNVLASVAGTYAAKEAVMDAQIPQTAKVDRRTATTDVTYNGQPQFAPISGTQLEYAVNSPYTVLRYNGYYYVVDNGVWFVSNDPMGPWTVATERPDQVDMIPPTSPAYNIKYVYIYDVTPDYVYMGYTPGYLNSFIYGPTVVYGTGFYYDPWWGAYYYPRPWSWGFNIGYNPWYGWSFGFGYSWGWFNMGWGYHWGGWRGGWWGPTVYHPAYWGGYGGSRPFSFYGRNVTVNNNIRVNYNNNIYRNRTGVVPRSNVAANRPGYNNRPQPTNYDNTRGNAYSGRPNTNPGTYPSTQMNRPNQPYARPNSVFSDRQGNVFQRADQGQWQQHQNRQWQPVNNGQTDVTRNLNRQQQMRDRGQVRTQNFERARSTFGGGSTGGFRPSFGGSRPSGGGGGGGRPSGGGGGGGRSSRR